MSDETRLNVKPHELRRNNISDANVLSNKEISYQNRPTILPVRLVREDMLVYRMANGRTILEQERSLKRTGNDPDFFSSGQENDKAQREQHAILLELSKAPTANIYNELRTRGSQTAELLITSDGVVVNGNRRLSAMRQLYWNEGVASFEFIKAAVLPVGCTEDDINRIEDDLQLAPDLKMDYPWVAAARILEKRLSGKSSAEAEQIRKQWKLTPSDVSKKLGTLALVNEYLQLFDISDSRIKSLEKQEQAFIRLYKHVNSNISSPHLELEKLIAFRIIESRESFPKGRVAYDVIPRVKDFRSILLAETSEDEYTTLDPFSERDSTLQTSFGTPSKAELIAARLIDKQSDVVDDLVATYKTIRELDHDAELAQKPLELAGSAYRELLNIEFDSFDPQDRELLRNKLLEIQNTVADLIQGLSDSELG